MSDPGRRVALVTGGTRGIGLGIARALASDGWTLALCGVRPLTEVSATIDEFGGRAEYVQADIGSRADRQRLASTVHDRWGALNALVNNAGRAPAGTRGHSGRGRRTFRESAAHQPAGSLLPHSSHRPADGRAEGSGPVISGGRRFRDVGVRGNGVDVAWRVPASAKPAWP